MNNNDVLRRVRYILDLNDTRMVAMWALAGRDVTRATMSDWLKKEEDPAFVPLPDQALALFLDGLIIDKRGPREGPRPAPGARLGNNAILMKLKIAFSLRGEDVQALLQSVGLTISKPELSAFLRSPDHKHYRECQDQVLRNLLKGLQLKLRGGPPSTDAPAGE